MCALNCNQVDQIVLNFSIFLSVCLFLSFFLSTSISRSIYPRFKHTYFRSWPGPFLHSSIHVRRAVSTQSVHFSLQISGKGARRFKNPLNSFPQSRMSSTRISISYPIGAITINTRPTTSRDFAHLYALHRDVRTFSASFILRP